jgi:hypothetical protein
VSELLPNPERYWDPEQPMPPLDRAEVERRIGSTSDALELLAGGLGNLNIRVGCNRVLRIYRGDKTCAAKEAALLSRGWQSFRVPSLSASGDDFLVLEFVAHEPLRASAEHGTSVGRALAEIHAIAFPSAGPLAADLSVQHPFADPLTNLYDYAFRSRPSSKLPTAAI